MGWHHPAHAGAGKFAEWNQVIAFDVLVGAVVDRNFVVRIAAHKAVAGEMLADPAHPRRGKTGDQFPRQFSHDKRVAMEGSIPDHRAFAIIQIQHRRETEIHRMR